MDVSVVVCSRDGERTIGPTIRAVMDSLRESGIRGEVVLVDNGSQDATVEVAHSVLAPAERALMTTVHRQEPGVAGSRNLGALASHGSSVLFADDDVVVDPAWVSVLHEALASGAHAVQGLVALGEEAARLGLNDFQAMFLAATPTQRAETPDTIISASVGLQRRIFQHGYRFDARLGPGCMGFMEDSLLGWQLREAGARVVWGEGSVATHHPDPARLQPESWIRRAELQGRCEAWVGWHWFHDRVDTRHVVRALGLSRPGRRAVGPQHALERLRRRSGARAMVDLAVRREPRAYPLRGHLGLP